MADFGTYSLADVAAQVKAADAKAFKRDAAPLARDDEITRYWKVDNHLRERVRPFLDLYGDGDHCIPPTPPATVPAECHAILNPMMDDGVSVPGWYRVVRNWEDAQLPGMVIQTLRRGWITALVSGTPASEGVPSTEAVDWSEARITDGDTGSLLPAPVGAGNNLSCRRRVVKIVWPCVDPTRRRAVAASLMALASTHTVWSGATIRGESIGTGGTWIRLGVSDRIADDGGGVVELVLCQAEAVFEFISNAGTIREVRETVVHGVAADAAQGYVANWQKYGGLSAAGTIPRGGSVSGSIDTASGWGTLSFSWKPLTAAAGAVVVGVYHNANSWQLHFIGWNQSAANLAAFIAGNPVDFDETDRVALGGTSDWMVNTTSITSGLAGAAEWSLGAFDYDDETMRYRWHVILRPVSEGNLDDKISYTATWKNRRMWDNTNRVWVPQIMGIQYGHQHKLFASFEDAWDFRKTSVLGETPYPRLVGDLWLAVRDFVNCCTGWCDENYEEQAYGSWVNPTAYDTNRFGQVPGS